MKSLPYTHLPLLAALTALAFLLAPAPAAAALSGSAELEYVRYDSEKNGSREVDATSFRHNYSLSYNTAGKFMGGRLGAYKGMLGYEWGSFDTTVTTPTETFNPSISRGNLLYNGDLLVDPRELPLRLRIYSRDTLRSNFQQDSISVLSGNGNLIDPGINTDISGSGIHNETGATLRLGIKNGMTNGYNAIFRHVPLLLLDYSDIVRKDDKAQFRVDTRLRKLAFISLNKKDNWFHYRVTKFTDNITPFMSYSESQLQLGTVDERLQRQWVSITNWISLSSDIQFTKRQESGRLPIETYDANLFLMATRAKWELRNFNSFSRQFDYNARKVRMDRNIPFYLSGIWGQETDWSVRLVSEETTERPVDAPVIDNRDLLAAYRINTFNRSRFTLSHTGEVEHYTNRTAKTLILAGSLQTASTRRFSDLYRLSASYSIKRFGTETQGASDSSMAHDLKGKATYQHPSRRFLLEFTEDINIVDGVSATNSETTLYASGTLGYSSSKAQSSIQGYKRFNTAVKVGWTPQERLEAGGSVIHEMLSEEGKETEQNFTTSAHLRYKQQRFTASISSTYLRRFSGRRDNTQLQASADAAYFVSRDMDFGLKGSYTNTSDSGTSTTNMDLRQDFSYRYMGGTGTIRKILEVSENFTYTRTAASSGNPFSQKKLTLGLHYYPWAMLSLSNRASYGWNDPGSQTELIYNGSITLSYPKLQASLDYSYGTRDAKNDKRKESRIAANVKKFF